MNVRWTETALVDVQAARAYVERHSPQYAQSLVERIFRCSGRLESHPLLGPVVPEYEEESIREIFEAPYPIVY